MSEEQPEPPAAPPAVTASAEELAALMREYFGIQRSLQSVYTSRRDTERKRKRLKHVQATLMQAVDFDRSWHPHMPQVLATKRAAREAQAE